ncbi:MAG: hypothetical protein ACRDYX_02555 [Egibacteraceae bacterium]
MNQTLFSLALVAETAAQGRCAPTRPRPSTIWDGEGAGPVGARRAARGDPRAAAAGAGGGRARSPCGGAAPGARPRRDPAGLRRPAERSGPRA